MSSSQPPKPPRGVEQTLTDIARYLILVEGDDPEDVAERFERRAQSIRAVGDDWIRSYDNERWHQRNVERILEDK